MAYAIFVGRLCLALIFIVSGLAKSQDLAGTMEIMRMANVPSWFIFPAILFELGGGLMLVFGYRIRQISLLFAGFCLLTATLFHLDFMYQIQTVMFLKNIAMAGGFFVLFAGEPGAFAVDNARRNKERMSERQADLQSIKDR